MKYHQFLQKLEHQRLETAIRRAERGTSADIVVYITHHEAADALAAAQHVFTQRKLDQAKQDNSLLIFLSPASRTFAVVGGQALHDAVGQEWWNELAAILRSHFRTDYYSEGLEAAIKFAARALQQHFPAAHPDRAGQSDLVEE